MVCKHKSEWSYSWSKIEEDGKKFLKYHHPDASDDKIKERLKETKTKYDALYDFWAVLKAKGVFKTDTFWYFEPFGWVEQMKRVFGVLDKNIIYITRKWERWTGENGSSATFGTFVFDDITGFICEPYGPETTISNQDKRIPVGTYNLKWHFSTDYPKNKYTLQSAFGRKWNLNFPVLEYGVVCVYNENVSADRGILIHAGQDGGWTKGCILPSTTLNMNIDKRNTNLRNSVETLYEILDKIKEKGIKNVKLIIKDEIK
ncbi:hypothetical protein RCZ15_26200 [Capnocytophaga catalasegens]|uniref:DUF5675 domain-containing protein n=2 Tax=Capnocytophaga catalasegens TaxID=1004260 RepID=A0AAV5B0K9_9FLAO|nr:DUF5675 family protein [Capnocytophaga catalasegens]GIZ16402.1 hypothetical protein RCZ03_24020 [Capnocytophaga catalasegens]GJM51647.1 hypothetical protein RCZ15_26200 [Capnocytophaga catalasegens]GJM54220.1 hypothetical protein RCZ16_25360 [Capnocytophaga catalasegens]